MDKRGASQWWQKTEVLTGVSLVALAFIGASPLMVSPEVTLYGMSARYFMAAVIVPVVLAVGVFWVAARQERLDRRHSPTDD